MYRKLRAMWMEGSPSSLLGGRLLRNSVMLEYVIGVELEEKEKPDERINGKI
jgi:hypothetical protein